jgi:predicted RNA methylase
MQEMQSIFDFLNAHGGLVKPSDDARLILELIDPHMAEKWQLSKFKNMGESLIYANLIIQALKQESEKKVLIDFGAGSSLPTILALKYTGNDKIKIVSVDNDPEAIAISKKNTEVFGCSNQYEFVVEDFFRFLKHYTPQPKEMVASNLPFLPVPADIGHSNYSFLDAGSDGTKYLTRILDFPWPSGFIIALDWCSLANPQKITNQISSGFRVLFAQAFTSRFGQYSGASDLLPFLLENRRKGISLFHTDEQGTNTFLYVQTLLQKR